MAKRKAKAVDSIERAIVRRCNELAREFYSLHGYRVPDRYRFDEAHHPQEKLMWRMAVIAFEGIEGTDVEDCLNQMNDETEEH